MKRTLLLLTLCVAALCANAQDHKRPAGRDVLSHRQQLALTQTAQSKAAFEYRLDNFYASDDYEYVNYFYTPEGRCIAIETSYGYVGWNDYLHTFDSLRYDANGDMVRLDCYQEMDTGWAYVNYCEYTYENHLLASRENYNWLGGQFELGGRYVFSYNAQGQMTQSKLWFFNEWYDQTDYTYDAQGHLTQVLYKVDINFNGVLVDYERTDYTLNEAGLPTVESIYQADQYNIMRLVVRNTYEYDANGNCTLYESKNGSGAWREKKEFVYEERLLSETYIPHTYEHPNPNTYHNLNTYSSMHYWAADDNYVLQDVCFYYYEYTSYVGINTPTNVALSLYPNPTSERMTVVAEQGDNLLAIYSLDGHCVKVQRMNGSDVTVDLSGVASGLYIVRVQGRQPRTARVIVSH